MIIRKAVKKDAEQLAKLYLQFWEVHKDKNPLHQPHYKINYKNCLKDMKEVIVDKEYELYVAEENEEVIGCILFTIKKLPKFYKIRKYGYLEECVVDKKHRGKGVATKLGNSAISYFKRKGIKYVSGVVELDNLVALKVWEKFGLKKETYELVMKI